MMGTSATTHATAVDTSNGVALVFTTTRYVDDLRARVREIATMEPSKSSVEDVPGGARIVFVSTDPSRVSALREQVHKRAQTMEQGRCPGMAPPPQPLPPEVKDELEMLEGG